MCGGTGSWAKPYKDAGYEVVTITLPDYNILDWVYLGDSIIFLSSGKGKGYLKIKREDIYGVLAAPPCTMFSFARTHPKVPRNLEEGMETVKACLDIIWFIQYGLKNQFAQKSTLKFWALENPNGHLKFLLGRPVYTFDPYEFGDMYSKKTNLWGWFEFPVKTHGKEARKIENKFDKLSMKEIRSIGDNIFRDRSNRQELRSITPQGFAQAFYKENH